MIIDFAIPTNTSTTADTVTSTTSTTTTTTTPITAVTTTIFTTTATITTTIATITPTTITKNITQPTKSTHSNILEVFTGIKDQVAGPQLVFDIVVVFSASSPWKEYPLLDILTPHHTLMNQIACGCILLFCL